LPLPDSPHADPEAIFIDSGYFFVFKHSPDPAGGADFLRLLTARETAGRFAAERGLPVAVNGANTRLNPSMAAVGRQLDGIQRTFGAASGEVPPGMSQAWNDVLHEVLSGKTEPAQAAAALERAAELVRNRAQHPDRVEVRYPGRALLFVLFLGAGLVLGVASGSPTSASGGEAGPRALFLGPSLAVYSLFFVLPALASLGFCLTRWDGLAKPEYVGLLHFRRLLLESDGFWTALGNNLYLMVVIPAVVVPLALFLANCLNQGLWGSGFFRVAFFFPNLLGVAGILLWQQLYNPQGPINRLFGIDTPWLSPDHLYHALIPMGVWGACGFNMVLYLAAMQSVPGELYEAAELDGASDGHKFFQITLPMIWDTLAASLIFMLIAGMKAFEAIWLLTNQSPTTGTHVVGTLMVRSMFTDMRIGEAAAIACLLFAMVFVGSALTARFTESEAIER
ncbi:MAG: ABC transporter permease subunit, partial [Candidatus Eremiobacteraeota bacterium]|nr:ABC transporter permease subunit [Candidatus Eremiobacteraeota bacterium]